MIILLGGTGYVGSAFRAEMERRSIEFTNISRSRVDYTNTDVLYKLICDIRPTFLINAAGYTGKPNVDSCEQDKANCLIGNAVLPGVIRTVCEQLEIPWGHVSSGCIYTGSKPNGSGFNETDPPNFCFRTDNCSFYSGTKAIGEECLSDSDSNYIWRLRIPFDSVDSPRNYISKLLRYERLLEATNSISHLQDFVSACLQCWEKKVPFGIYNITNTGSVTTHHVVEMIKHHLKPNREFDFFIDEDQFMQLAAKTPRSNCVLDNSKLLSVGIRISSVEEALDRSLRSWQPQAIQSTIDPRSVPA